MFQFESALNASGNTSFQPGDFSFASFAIADFVSSQLMEWSMSGTVSCLFIVVCFRPGDREVL